MATSSMAVETSGPIEMTTRETTQSIHNILPAREEGITDPIVMITPESVMSVHDPLLALEEDITNARAAISLDDNLPQPDSHHEESGEESSSQHGDKSKASDSAEWTTSLWKWIKRIALLTGIIACAFTAISIWPVFDASKYADWTAKKDFLEFCADDSKKSLSQSCNLTINYTLPPPPHFLDPVHRRLKPVIRAIQERGLPILTKQGILDRAHTFISKCIDFLKTATGLLQQIYPAVLSVACLVSCSLTMLLYLSACFMLFILQTIWKPLSLIFAFIGSLLNGEQASTDFRLFLSGAFFMNLVILITFWENKRRALFRIASCYCLVYPILLVQTTASFGSWSEFDRIAFSVLAPVAIGFLSKLNKNKPNVF